MGSVSSVNPALANILQTISGLNPALSSPAVTSALENAPPADIIQLSDAATQMQSVDALFGSTDSSGPSGMDDMTSLLASLEQQQPATSLPSTSTAASSTSSTTSTSSASSSSTQSPQDQLANELAAFQSIETQGLFGTSTTSNPLNSLFDVSA